MRTATIYLQSIRFFGDWWAGRGDPVVVVRAGREIRVGTVRTRYKGLRRFCRWLVAEGELDSDPVLGMDVPSVVDRPVPVLTDDDLAALVKACAGKDLTGRRDEVVIRFLPDTGCRVSELCGLAVDDIDLDTEKALVTGKGSKVRPVYFGARTARSLDRYPGSAASTASRSPG